MSYTSFDTAGSAGGWRVKQTAGDLHDAEKTLLLSGVHTRLNLAEHIPSYPTLEQLQRIPRRLAYRRVNRNAGCYWHTVPAGADHTGRPGNVFIHALLDRAAGTPDGGYRPIELWRSPRWLDPYGATAVTHAELPADPPGPGGVVTRDSVVEFACDTGTWRLGTLFGLLDAVAAAIDGGPIVVLGVDSIDTAAQWIGLVSFLMSPGTARMLNFSTFDRADQLGFAMRVGQHLSAVPRDDLIDAPAGVVTIDETQTLSLGELGGEPHRTAAGQPIEVTAWSAMAQVAMLDPDSMRLVLADIDAFSARVTDAGLHPAWPMAMSALTRSRFADADYEARSVIARNSPRGTVADAEIMHAITDVARAAEPTELSATELREATEPRAAELREATESRAAEPWEATESRAAEPREATEPREPTELLTLDWDRELPARELVRTLVCTPDSPAIIDLATRVVNENKDETAVACAAVRLYEPDDWIRFGWVHTHQPHYSPHWDDAVEMADPNAVHADFARRLLVLTVVGTVLGEPCPRSCGRLLTDETLETQVVEQVEALVDTNALSPNTVLAVGLLPPNGTIGMRRLFQRLSTRLAATFPWDADQVNDVAQLMGQIDGTGDEESVHRFRKMVLDVLHGPADGARPVAVQSRWSV